MACDRPELVRGWAVPCATDIAFSYLIARFLFGPGHPAIRFLLLVAVTDDAAGLIILATVYPEEEGSMGALGSAAGMILTVIVARLLRVEKTSG